MSRIAIIPARGGSKRIPRKNIKDFLGKPVIAYSIEAALQSNLFDEVMVSTDDDEIADTARKFGADVPFMRGKKNSGDLSTTSDVLTEVIGEYKKIDKTFDIICCLYSCAPFVTSKMLTTACGLLADVNVDSVIPLIQYSHPPQRAYAVRDGKAAMLKPENMNIRTQDLEPMYHDAGQFYFIRTNIFNRDNKLICGNTIPVFLNECDAVDIDSESDWNNAEMKYRIARGML